MTTLDVSDWKHAPERAREVLIQGTCPVCGHGPWKSPLNHVSRKHGIDRRTMRDVCDLTMREKVTDPELSQRLAEVSAERDMSKVRSSRPRAQQQWTRRGRAKNTATIETANQDPAAPTWRSAALARAWLPESRAKQAAALKERWDSLPPEERRRRTGHLKRDPEQLSVQAFEAWTRRGRQPCGTRAAYRRGCRCESCRAAYLAYRRAHG